MDVARAGWKPIIGARACTLWHGKEAGDICSSKKAMSQPARPPPRVRCILHGHTMPAANRTAMLTDAPGSCFATFFHVSSSQLRIDNSTDANAATAAVHFAVDVAVAHKLARARRAEMERDDA
mmetsp:Transcript_36723/g.80620  ORF Transcript_36723/g.80620 Transcript_36723/m.80620 type:complete len:123 (-) Transcript_36723:185-553(-)